MVPGALGCHVADGSETRNPDAASHVRAVRLPARQWAARRAGRRTCRRVGRSVPGSAACSRTAAGLCARLTSWQYGPTIQRTSETAFPPPAPSRGAQARHVNGWRQRPPIIRRLGRPLARDRPSGNVVGLGTRGAMSSSPSHPGEMTAPIVVHGLSRSGGRRVATKGKVVGLVHNDSDLVEFLRRAGLDDAWELVDDAHWIEWRRGRAPIRSSVMTLPFSPLTGRGASVVGRGPYGAAIARQQPQNFLLNGWPAGRGRRRRQADWARRQPCGLPRRVR